MAREKAPTRAAVFEAADALVESGAKVTVTAVRNALGAGGAEPVRKLLVEWRRERRGRATGGGPSVGAAATLPVPVRRLVDGQSQQLSRAIVELLAESLEPDAQTAVIRAAAEARVRECEAMAADLEEQLVDLQDRLAVAEAEREGLQVAIETAAEASNADGSGLLAARLRTMTAERDSLRAEVDRLSAMLDTPRPESPLDPETARSDPELAARAIEEALARLRELEGERDALEAERDAARAEAEALRAQTREVDAESARLRAETAVLGKDRDLLRSELRDAEARLEKQAEWIREARGRMEKAGMLRTRKAG